MSEITHARAILVDAPPDAVRVWVSDPLRFPNIYPSWLNKVRKIGQHGDGEAYEGVTPHGDKVKIIPKLGPKPGQAYFEIGDKDDNVEVFYPMVQPRKSGTKTILGYWWEGVDDAFREGYKLGTLDADLKRVKEVIERNAMQGETRTDTVPHQLTANGQEKPLIRYPHDLGYDEPLDELENSRKDGEIHIPTFALRTLQRLKEFPSL